MGYAILRTQKLKSPVAVHRSLKHAMREQDTPNADRTLTPDNTHFGAGSVDEALQRFNGRLPEKYRKDAVLCIEYLVTATPASMASLSRPQQDAYLMGALEWLRARHGAENVFYAGIHRDETTPHLYAYVVPRDGERLNCRKWLGGSKALSQMQTEFAEVVGQSHGLERGIERSRARHVSIREFYSRISAPTPDVGRAAHLPQPKVLETKRQYGERVYEHVRGTVSPVLRSVSAKLTQAELVARDAQGFRRAAEESRQAVSSARLDVEVQRRHGQQKLERTETQLREVLELVLRGGPALEQRRQTMLAALGRQVENRSRGLGRGRDIDHDEPDLDHGPKLGL
jgi:hypothetical protein